MNISDLISAFARYVHRINDQDVSQMAGIAEGTAAATLKPTIDIYYSLYNKPGLIKTATDNIAMTACAQQAVSTFCYYLVSINATGTVTTTKGTDNTYALPSTPSGNVPIGAFKVTTDASHTFTSGTTDLSAAGITAAFSDMDCGIATTLINAAQTRLERGVVITVNGRQRTIMDFEHMIVRAQETISAGDSTVTLPFPNYKDFMDDRLSITDSSGVTYPMGKRDVMPMGIVFQSMPTLISRMPPVETVFTLDGFPAREFDIWPESDADYTIDTTAYQYSPALDGVIYSSNWLTTNAPDVLLFGALVEAASYFPADQRFPEWNRRWEEAVLTLYQSQQKERISGSPIYTKFPDPLRRKDGLGMTSNKAGIMSFGFIDTGN